MKTKILHFLNAALFVSLLWSVPQVFATCPPGSDLAGGYPQTTYYCSGTTCKTEPSCNPQADCSSDADCGACTDRSWSPSPTTVCSGDSFDQTSNCGTTRSSTGTKNCSTNSCTDTSWSPSPITVCSGDSFDQTSNCGTTRSATGTKDCSTNTNSGSGSSSGGSSSGSSSGGCTPTTWTPSPSTICSGTNFLQTSNCGTTKPAAGTKNCSTNNNSSCTPTTWTPDPSTVCSGQAFTQTSNCSTTTVSTGTKNCTSSPACGSAADTYTPSETGWRTNPPVLCSKSVAVPSTVVFPDPGKSVTWQCSAQYASTPCFATHQKNPDYIWAGNVHNSAWGNLFGWLAFGQPTTNSPYYGRYTGVKITASGGSYILSGKAYSRDFGLVDFSGATATVASTANTNSSWLLLQGNATFVSIGDFLKLSNGTVDCSASLTQSEPQSATDTYGVCIDTTDGSPTKGMAFGYGWSDVYGAISFAGDDYDEATYAVDDMAKSKKYQVVTEIGSTIPNCSAFDPTSPAILQSGLVVGWIETCGPSFGNFLSQRLTNLDEKNQCTVGGLQKGSGHGGGGGFSGPNEGFFPHEGVGSIGMTSMGGGMNMANGDSENGNYNINCNGDPIVNVLSSVGVPVISANNAPYARENIKQRLINLACLAGETGVDVGTIITNYKLNLDPFNVDVNADGLTNCAGTGTNNNTNGSGLGYTCQNYKCVRTQGGDNTLCNMDSPQNFFKCDLLPPSFKVSPQSGNYDITTITSSPAIILKATDNESGLKQVNYKWSLNNPDTTSVISSPDGVLYPTMNNNYALQASLPMPTTEGAWYLNIYVLDNAGNHAGPANSGPYNIKGTSTHYACNGSLTAPACALVTGSGANTCSPSSSSTCILPSHRECQGSSCTVVAGAGSSLCSVNKDCTVTFHKTCSSGQCTTVPGEGADLCSKRSDCTVASHKECVASQCAVVPGAGADQCSCPADTQCLACTGIIGGRGFSPECIPGVPTGETCNKNDPDSNCYDHPMLDGCDTTCPQPTRLNCGFDFRSIPLNQIN